VWFGSECVLLAGGGGRCLPCACQDAVLSLAYLPHRPYPISKDEKDTHTMDTELRDRVVLITGASSGIGAATARAYGREGARVAIT
jgi:hypothetical protein